MILIFKLFVLLLLVTGVTMACDKLWKSPKANSKRNAIVTGSIGLVVVIIVGLWLFDLWFFAEETKTVKRQTTQQQITGQQKKGGNNLLPDSLVGIPMPKIKTPAWVDSTVKEIGNIKDKTVEGLIEAKKKNDKPFPAKQKSYKKKWEAAQKKKKEVKDE